jgi:MYXO-CTERM domain-containing protein
MCFGDPEPGSLHSMGIMNKRNAVLGWTAWQVGKRMMKRKARDAVPGRVDDSMRPNKGAIAAALVAVGGALLFWRRRRDDEPA